MKKPDTKYLRIKGNTYQLQYPVKKGLESHPLCWGKKLYIKSLETDDLRTAKIRRDLIVREFELYLEDSKSASFRAQVEQLREINRQFIQDNPDFGDDRYGYTLLYEEVERDAKNRGIKLNDRGQLPDNLPDDLQLRLDALQHAQRQESKPETTLLPPTKYQESLRDIEKRTVKLKRQLGKREKTLGKYSRSVDAFLDYLGVKDIPIALIRRKQVVEFSNAMQVQYAGSTVHNFLSFLSEIWKTARDLELLEGDNPFQEQKVKEDKKSYLPWTEDQLKKLYELLPEEDRLPFKIGVYTGARIDEIITLQPEDIQEVKTDDGKVTCLHLKARGNGKTKNATRLVPVHRALVDDLKEFEPFEVTSGNYSKRFGRVKRKYLGEDDTRRLCFHSIRHTLATALHRAGIDELVISYITGHANQGRTEAARTYIHGPMMRQMQEALEKLPVIV
ncbi:MAG: tyrosine-type recombinase/integrase [Sedimenticola sp.]